MNFYTRQHKHYCGIDLHAKAMYVCILDRSGTKLIHKNLPTTPKAFLRLISPYPLSYGLGDSVSGRLTPTYPCLVA